MSDTKSGDDKTLSVTPKKTLTLKRPGMEQGTVRLSEAELSDELQKLGASISVSTAQYNNLPEEARVELGWRGIAWYHGADGAVTRLWYGVGSPEDNRMARIKDQRLAALTDEARDVAIYRANAWLDDNFSE